MTIQYTFSILKPDATRRNLTGKINSYLEAADLQIVAAKRIKMTKEMAETFYEVHKARPFFNDLVSFMTSGPIVAAVLTKEHAVADFRTLIGATNPADAAEGTIRAKYAVSIDANAIHGSDSDENAAGEASFFFSAFEMF